MHWVKGTIENSPSTDGTHVVSSETTGLDIHPVQIITSVQLE